MVFCAPNNVGNAARVGAELAIAPDVDPGFLTPRPTPVEQNSNYPGTREAFGAPGPRSGERLSAMHTQRCMPGDIISRSSDRTVQTPRSPRLSCPPRIQSRAPIYGTGAPWEWCRA
jgi:hypothetical protein